MKKILLKAVIVLPEAFRVDGTPHLVPPFKVSPSGIQRPPRGILCCTAPL
jgi:hypothetical protein